MTSGKTSPNGTRYCRACGFAGCPSLDLDGGGCPRWPAPDRVLLFGQLTLRERTALAIKLHNAGHAFYESADAIGRTALHLEKAGRISALSDEWEGLWAARAPLADAMEEMYDLMREVVGFAWTPGA